MDKNCEVILKFREPIRLFLTKIELKNLTLKKLKSDTFSVLFDCKLFAKVVRMIRRSKLDRLLEKIYYGGLIFFSLEDFAEYYLWAKVKERLLEHRLPYRFQKIFNHQEEWIALEILFEFPEGFHAVDVKDFTSFTADVDLLIVINALGALKRLRDDKEVMLNVFPSTLTDRIFAAVFLETVRALELENLTLEVLEYAVADRGQFLKILGAMRSSGVKVALDDWGSENAGIIRIISVNPEFIKIDKSITWHRQARKLAKPFIRTIQRELKIRVVVEGIDNEIQKRWAQSMGAYMQGYYLHRPEPLANLLDEDS